MTAADLAARLGLRRRVRSWAGACPSCSYPGAFSIRAGRDGRARLFCGNGCDADALRLALGDGWTPPPRDPAKAERGRAAKQEAAERLWRGAVPCAATPAGQYLRRRELPHLVDCPALRFRGDTPHPEGGRLPALLAQVVDGAGQAVALHRTFLDPTGRKAAADPAKASLGPTWGAAIRLDPVAAELVVGEGIETAAAAGLLLGQPAWAAINAGNLQHALALPDVVRAVTIAADPDPPGQRAADGAAVRWRAEGREVRILTPDEPGQDFADLLAARVGRA